MTNPAERTDLGGLSRCWSHNLDIVIPPRYLLKTIPAGNVIPLCADCVAYHRAECPEGIEWVRSL